MFPASKMDVETYEPQVLRGASRLLTQHRPIIFLEILAAADVGALEEIRAGADYSFGRLVPTGVRWERTLQYEAHHNDCVLCPTEKRELFHQAIRLARLEVS